MEIPNELEKVLSEGRAIRFVANGIYSAMPDDAATHHYDKIASVYDRVIGTQLYNKFMWGSSPMEYKAFARRAVRSSTYGSIVEAACGSLLFTADAYLETNRTIIAFDQSLSMLQNARNRLIESNGTMPKNVHLVQADLIDIPFRPNVFETIVCMNVLHLYEDAVGLISTLNDLRKENGNIFMTSLVLNQRTIGDLYLKALSAAGEVVRPRRLSEIAMLLDATINEPISISCTGNMAFMSALTENNGN